MSADQLTPTQINALAQRISDLGAGVNLESLLGALGMVVTGVLEQYPSAEERMAATVSWIAMLSQSMIQDYKRRSAN